MKKLNNQGMAPVFIVLITLTVVGVGFAGFRVYKSNKENKQPETSTAQTQQDKPAEEKIISASEKQIEVPDGWVLYEDKDTGIKFAYPETWKTTYGFAASLAVKNPSEAVAYEGCIDSVCEVKYDPATSKVLGNGGAETKNPVATKDSKSAYLIAEKGSFNCGSYGLLIPVGEKVIHSRLSLCSKPSGPDDHQLSNGDISYEEVVADLSKLLETIQTE